MTSEIPTEHLQYPDTYGHEDTYMPEQPIHDDIPSLEHILDNWISVKDASEIMRLKGGTVRQLCIDSVIRAKKLGNQWFIDPESARSHKKGQHRKD